MRHGAETPRIAEPVRGGGVGVADETLGPCPFRRRRANGRGVGHQILHVRAGAVARLHREECCVGQCQAHLPGIVGSDAGRANLLQEDGLHLRQRRHRARDGEQRYIRRDQCAFSMRHDDVERLAACRGGPGQPFQHHARGAQHWAPRSC